MTDLDYLEKLAKGHPVPCYHVRRDGEGGFRSRFWLVWRDGGFPPNYRHISKETATTEAQRLARENPGTIFHVLVVERSCCKADVVTHDYTEHGDNTPF